jgi:hypothetical protein
MLRVGRLSSRSFINCASLIVQGMDLSTIAEDELIEERKIKGRRVC